MSKRSSRVRLSATYLTLAASVGAGTLVACSMPPDDQAYCGDENRQVLPAAQCEDGDGVGIIYVGAYGAGGARYKPGDTLPMVKGGRSTWANDSSGRIGLGLPARGGFGGNGAEVSSGG